MKPLSDAQYEALGRTRKKAGVLVSGPRKHGDGPRMIPEGCISPQVANVLIDAGFAQMVDGTLRATQAGRRVVDGVRPEGPGLYLDANPARPLTRSLEHSARDEPEVMIPDKGWSVRAEDRRRADARDTDTARLSGLTHPQERERELRRMAAERGVDVGEEVKRAVLTRKAHERAVRALERKLSDEEAA